MYLHKGPSELFPCQRENVHVLHVMHICFSFCPVKHVRNVVVFCPPCSHVICVDSPRHWMGQCQLNAIHWDYVHLLLLFLHQSCELWTVHIIMLPQYLQMLYVIAMKYFHLQVHDVLEGVVRCSVFISSGRRCQLYYGNIFRWWCVMRWQVV